MEQTEVLKALLVKTAAFVRQQGQTINELKEELASFHKQKQAVKVASDMADKGFISSAEIDEKATELASEEDLAPVEFMIKHASKENGIFAGTKGGYSGFGQAEQNLMDFTFGN